MISLMSEEGHVKYKIYEFVIDTVAELSDVPTDVGVGSKVYCIEDSKVYMLSNSGEYKEVSFSSGGGSGDVESYIQLSDKPSINGVTLINDKTSEDLKLVNIKEVIELPSPTVDNTVYIVKNPDNTEDFYVCINGNAHEIKGGTESIFLVDELPTTKVDGALYIVKGDESATPPTKDTMYFYKDNDLYEIETGCESIFLVDELPEQKENGALYIVKGDDTATPPTKDAMYFYKDNELYKIETHSELIFLVNELPTKKENGALYIVKGDDTVTPPEKDKLYFYKDNNLYEVKTEEKSMFLVDVLPSVKRNDSLYIVKGDDTAIPPTMDRLYFYENDSLYEIETDREAIFLVDELPTVKINKSLYIVKGDSEADPPTLDKFYFYSNNSVYAIDASVIDYRDNLRLLNKPQIDEHELLGLNNTHESLELISEKDFVSAPTAKTDGMEFILPQGTPDNPIEITEINDTDEFKYSLVHTSSNEYINTNLDELFRLVEGKMQILFETELPDPPAINTMYFIDTEVPNVYHCWLVDSMGTVKDGGVTNIDLSNYVMKTVKVGSNALDANVTTAMLNSDLKDYTTEIKNKTINVDNNTLSNIQTSNFKNDVIKTAIPLTPLDTELLTAKAVDTALKDKQDKLTAGAEITTVADETTVSQVDLTNKKSSPISALSVWNYIKGKFTASTVTTVEDTTTIADVNTSNANPVSRFTAAALWTYILTKLTTTIGSASTNQQAPSNKAVYDYVEARRRYLHVLERKNNDSLQYPMGWVAIITDNDTETYESIAKWLYDNQHRSMETSYYWVGGCCGTTGVRNQQDTGTSYIGRVTSGAFSADGTTITFKFDYNGTVGFQANRAVVHSHPMMKLTS